MTRFIVIALAIMLAASPVCAEFDGSRFVGISGADQAAVIKQVDGSLRLVRIGDKVGEEAVLVGFDGDHVVLQMSGEWGPVTVYVALENGEQQVWRMERRPLESSIIYGRGEVGTLSPESQ